MQKKIFIPSREDGKRFQSVIIKEYSELLEISLGKSKMKILERLASKYGYSCGQAVRNMINNYNKKENAVN